MRSSRRRRPWPPTTSRPRPPVAIVGDVVNRLADARPEFVRVHVRVFIFICFFTTITNRNGVEGVRVEGRAARGLMLRGRCRLVIRRPRCLARQTIRTSPSYVCGTLSTWSCGGRVRRLWGICKEPRSRAPPRVTSVVLVRPYPVLCGSTSTGTLHLWRVPECTLISSLTFVDSPATMPFVQKPSNPAFLTDIRKPEVKDVSFGCVDVAVHDAGCTLSAGADDGTCVVWPCPRISSLMLVSKNALTKRDNYNPRRSSASGGGVGRT